MEVHDIRVCVTYYCITCKIIYTAHARFYANSGMSPKKGFHNVCKTFNDSVDSLDAKYCCQSDLLAE